MNEVCEEFQASAASTLPKTLIISLASFWLLMLIHPSAHANRKTIEPWKKRKAWMEEKYRSLAFATEVFPVVTWIRPLKEETMNETHGKSYVSLIFAWATACLYLHGATFAQSIFIRFFCADILETLFTVYWFDALPWPSATRPKTEGKHRESLMSRHQLGAF